MLKFTATLGAGLATLTAIWWFGFAGPLTKTALVQPKGENTAPRYFSVPSRIDDATKKLNELGFRLYSIEEADHCISRDLGRRTKVYIFADDSWRQGTLCIVPNGENVGEIYWLFQLGAP